MLIELKVSHFAIIDSIQIAFQPGLNILSGETGAGKSVLLKSLALLMGEKALADTVRSGREMATVEGLFDLSDRSDIIQSLIDLGIDVQDDQLIVRRQISAQGKSKVYLNGSLAPLTHLREVVSPLIAVTGQSAPLIEMTGQHDNRHLQSTAYHLDLLDHYCGAWNLRQSYGEKFDRLKAIHQEISEIEESQRQREQRLDFLNFQCEEIRQLQLEPGEEEDLLHRLQRNKNSTRLIDFCSQSEGALYADDDSALVRIHQVLQRLQDLKSYDPLLAEKLSPLAQAKTLIEESVYDLRDYAKSLDSDPSELNRLEERVSLFRKLQKKYGPEVEDILNALKEMEQEVRSLENSDQNLQELRAEQKKLEQSLRQAAEDLHNRRANGAKLLAKGVNEELLDLNMKGVIFHIQVEPRQELSPTGMSQVEFMIQASKKDSLRPLAKFASGGELSRILLSLKRIVGSSGQPRTYLFDEVDAGVSGETAEKVGRKLKSIAQGQQVICVTHLPQVASCGDSHFLIEKSPSRQGVHMSVRELNKEDRVKEIARLISGEKITKTSLDHARQLMG